MNSPTMKRILPLFLFPIAHFFSILKQNIIETYLSSQKQEWAAYNLGFSLNQNCIPAAKFLSFLITKVWKFILQTRL